MLKKNIVAIAVGIGIFGLLAILIVLRTMPSDTSGSKQDAAVVSSAFGTISLPEGISRLEADGVKGLVSIKPDNQTARMPAGLYNVRYWKTERKDESGNNWALVGQYYGQDNQFEIEADNETKLDVGEPIVATVDAINSGSNYSFNQIIKGRGQEIIQLTCNNSRPQPPKLHIKNKDGSYDKTFSFRYG
jgi:hypothetical protein